MSRRFRFGKSFASRRWFGCYDVPRRLHNLIGSSTGAVNLRVFLQAFLDPLLSQAERAKRVHDQMHAMNLPKSFTPDRLKKALKELKRAKKFVGELEVRASNPEEFCAHLRSLTHKLSDKQQRIVDTSADIVWSDNPKSSKHDEMKQRYFFTPFGSPLAQLVRIQRDVAEARTVVFRDEVSGAVVPFVVMASSLRDIAQTLPIAVHEGFHYRYQTRESGDEKQPSLDYLINEALIERQTRAGMRRYLATADDKDVFAKKVRTAIRSYLRTFYRSHSHRKSDWRGLCATLRGPKPLWTSVENDGRFFQTSRGCRRKGGGRP